MLMDASESTEKTIQKMGNKIFFFNKTIAYFYFLGISSLVGHASSPSLAVLLLLLSAALGTCPHPSNSLGAFFAISCYGETYAQREREIHCPQRIGSQYRTRKREKSYLL